MDTPEEKAAFDDGKDYVVHELQEWIKKKRREIGIECARVRYALSYKKLTV